MLNQEDPSNEVIAFLTENRKIDAIKLVREEKNMGLKEAKEFVESYMLRHPERFENQRATSSVPGPIVWILIAIAALLIYQFMSKTS